MAIITRTPVYGSAASQTVGISRDWADLANITGAPDGAQATVAALLAEETTEVAIIGPDGLGLSMTANEVARTIYLTPRVADSGYVGVGEASVFFVQLYDATTPIGTALAVECTAAALTYYHVGGDSASWGVDLNATMLATLRVGISMTGVAASSNVGVDSVKVELTTTLKIATVKLGRLTRFTRQTRKV